MAQARHNPSLSGTSNRPTFPACRIQLVQTHPDLANPAVTVSSLKSWWWLTPIIQVLGSLRQKDCRGLEPSLGYSEWDPVSKPILSTWKGVSSQQLPQSCSVTRQRPLITLKSNNNNKKVLKQRKCLLHATIMRSTNKKKWFEFNSFTSLTFTSETNNLQSTASLDTLVIQQDPRGSPRNVRGNNSTLGPLF